MANHTASPLHFLGIGAQKAGTTWLFEHLRKHPQLFVPHVKEIHYFDRSDYYQSPGYLGMERLEDRLAVGSNSRWARMAQRFLSRPTNLANALDRWMLKYLFGNYDDEWYLDLFRDTGGRKGGEITPAYSMLTDADVEHAATLAPDAKLIFLIRHPVEREWSQFRFELRRFRLRPSPPTIQSMILFLQQDHVAKRSDYIGTIDRWSRYFGDENLLLLFFDEIKQHPQKLLNKVCRFLEIAPLSISEQQLRKPRHQSMKIPMPPEIGEILRERHVPLIAELANRYGSYAIEWLDGEAIGKKARND